ncbi:MAG: YdcF family protein [Clostridiales bacterium]|nr:YdcF family protein [Clostridiales bacterium]MDO4350113.1 ElyC/SanA/YdcF family protein [Eubacteriales bacterium]MDY4008785.1 ElyC/SanA/YdcF family protein [Candidatus Limiplasma sp.]
MNEPQTARHPQHGSHKRIKRLGIRLCCLTLAACAAVLGANVWMIARTRDAVYMLENAQALSGDCILVLGCGLRSDGTPSQMLRDRLDVGIAAYQQGIAPKLLMSGDHGRVTYDEVNAMKDYAIRQGVPSEDIFMDHAGFSTYESMYRAREIFQCEQVVVVTQGYHLYRAIYNARAMGMRAAGISSDLRGYARQRFFNAREALARVKDAVWCALRMPPAYLGEAIPIFGNGNATNDRV